MPGIPDEVAHALAQRMGFRLPPGEVEFLHDKYRQKRDSLTEVLADMDGDLQREAAQRAIPPGDPLLVARAELAADLELHLALLAALRQRHVCTVTDTPYRLGLTGDGAAFHHEVFGFDEGAWDGYLVISVAYSRYPRLQAARAHLRGTRREALLLQADRFNRLPHDKRMDLIRSCDTYWEGSDRDSVEDARWRKLFPDGLHLDRERGLLIMK